MKSAKYFTVLLGLLSGVALAAPRLNLANLDERLRQLELLIEQQATVRLHQDLQIVQQDIRELRGELENLTHDLSQLRERQQSFYMDLDRRLKAISPVSEQVAETDKLLIQEVPDILDLPQAQSQAPTITWLEITASLKQKDYERARHQLEQFVRLETDEKRQLNAFYELGEIYLLQGTKSQDKGLLALSLSAFDRLSAHSEHEKAPVSAFKRGVIHLQLGQLSQGRQEFHSVIQNYPESAAAVLARLKLDEIKEP